MEPVMSESDKCTQLIDALVDMDETSVLDQVKQRLSRGEDPFQILEEAQEGVRQVGIRYEQGNYYVAGLMFGGEIFCEVMELVQPILVKRFSGQESGHILVGTVKGDIHDIGKNIFATMLRANGFTVTDLGVDIPPAVFLDAAHNQHPDIIGLHGLLTTSYEMMRDTLRQIRAASDPDISTTPVILGGGTLNAMVCAYVGADYWTVDAMVGVELCKQMITQRRASATPA